MSFTKLPSDIQNLKSEKSFIKKIKLNILNSQHNICIYHCNWYVMFITAKCHNICDGGMYYYTIQELSIKLTNFRMWY